MLAPRGFESHSLRKEGSTESKVGSNPRRDAKRIVAWFEPSDEEGGREAPETVIRETRSRGGLNPTPSVSLPESSGAWLSPVERCVRVAEVPGSNPGAPIR